MSSGRGSSSLLLFTLIKTRNNLRFPYEEIAKKINPAEIAQLVEHNLAKVGVASSSLVFRSKLDIRFFIAFLCNRGREISVAFFLCHSLC